jgi:hypothetical protein
MQHNKHKTQALPMSSLTAALAETSSHRLWWPTVTLIKQDYQHLAHLQYRSNKLPAPHPPKYKSVSTATVRHKPSGLVHCVTSSHSINFMQQI